VLFEEAVDRGL
jgi:hypothetical protein